MGMAARSRWETEAIAPVYISYSPDGLGTMTFDLTRRLGIAEERSFIPAIRAPMPITRR